MACAVKKDAVCCYHREVEVVVRLQKAADYHAYDPKVAAKSGDADSMAGSRCCEAAYQMAANSKRCQAAPAQLRYKWHIAFLRRTVV